jgi:hypothetical protein
MRLVGWLLLVLVVAGCFVNRWPLANSGGEPRPAAEWRRTADGWERLVVATPGGESHRPALHPMIVAVLQVLLTLAAMIAFSAAGDGDKVAAKQSGAAHYARRSSSQGSYQFLSMRRRG